MKAKSYPIVNPAATDDQVYAVGQAIVSLQQDPVVAIERVDRAILTPDPSASTTSASSTTTAAPSKTI